MILQGICVLLFGIVNILLNIIPSFVWSATWMTDLIALIVKASQFFPMDVFAVVIGNIAFWVVVYFNWSLGEWVLKKIPRYKLIELRAVS